METLLEDPCAGYALYDADDAEPRPLPIATVADAPAAVAFTFTDDVVSGTATTYEYLDDENPLSRLLPEAVTVSELSLVPVAAQPVAGGAVVVAGGAVVVVVVVVVTTGSSSSSVSSSGGAGHFPTHWLECPSWGSQ